MLGTSTPVKILSVQDVREDIGSSPCKFPFECWRANLRICPLPSVNTARATSSSAVTRLEFLPLGLRAPHRGFRNAPRAAMACTLCSFLIERFVISPTTMCGQSLVLVKLPTIPSSIPSGL